MAYRFQKIVDFINNLTKSGVLETEDELFLKAALKDLGHAIRINNSKKIDNSVNKFCRRLLKKIV